MMFFFLSFFSSFSLFFYFVFLFEIYRKSSDEERIIKREPNDFSNIKSQISNHFQPQNLQIVPPIVHLSQPPPLISSATPKSHYFNSSIPPPLTSNNIQQTIIAPLVQFTPLQSIPQPKPIALNEIPAPKALDLNAIPKPQLDLDAIKIPENKGKIFFFDNNYFKNNLFVVRARGFITIVSLSVPITPLLVPRKHFWIHFWIMKRQTIQLRIVLGLNFVVLNNPCRYLHVWRRTLIGS